MAAKDYRTENEICPTLVEKDVIDKLTFIKNRRERLEEAGTNMFHYVTFSDGENGKPKSPLNTVFTGWKKPRLMIILSIPKSCSS
jgi:hypothetical protein